ncbi:MAG: hypothetical protein A2Z96_04730, partial [Spirochaetes bacterium GWB1_48_6]
MKKPGIIFLGFFLLFSFLGCMNRGVIKIGYVGALTGPGADLGTNGRNGLLIAFTPQAQKDVQNHTVELLFRDDEDNRDRALAIFKELDSLDCKIIISQQTSGAAVDAFSYANDHGILVLSSTVSSSTWDGKDDNILRIMTSNYDQGVALGDAALEDGHKRIYSIGVENNKPFADSILAGAAKRFQQGGGVIVGSEYLSEVNSTTLDLLVKRLKMLNLDAIAPLVLSTNDAALLAKQMEKHNYNVPVYVSAWTLSGDLPAAGGNSVNNFRALNFMEMESQQSKFRMLVEEYTAIYTRSPQFPSFLAYEAGTVLLETLRTSQDLSPQGLKKFILETKTFKGLQSDLEIDKYGDCKRKLFLYRIVGGKLV